MPENQTAATPTPDIQNTENKASSERIRMIRNWFKNTWTWKLLRFLGKDRETILGILAIILSVWAIRDVIRFRKEFDAQQIAIDGKFNQQKKTIEDIANYASTTYLPPWPEHTKYISSLVQNTEAGDSIVIAVDSLGYLHFSDPERFKIYWENLVLAAGRAESLRILTLGEDSSRQSLEQQFPDVSWNKVRNEPKFKETVIHYKDRYRRDLSNTKFFNGSPERGDFLDAVMYVENNLFRQLADLHVQIRVIHKPLKPTSKQNMESINESVFLWLSYRLDNNEPKNRNALDKEANIKLNEMVFAYPRFYGNKKGYAFHSKDGQLMQEFLYEFNQRWNTAERRTRKTELFPIIVAKVEMKGSLE